MRMPIDHSAIQLVSAGQRPGPRLQGDGLMLQPVVSLLSILLVLWILGWILAHAGLVVIGVLGLGPSSWWKPRGRGELCVQRHEPSAPGDPSRLGLTARGRTGSCQLHRSQAVDLPRERGPALVSGPKFTALADASVLDLAVEGQPPSPSQVTRWATNGRGPIERALEERIEEFNQTPPLEELPLHSRSSLRSQEFLPTLTYLHPNGAPQPLYLVRVHSRSLDVEGGHDGCR